MLAEHCQHLIVSGDAHSVISATFPAAQEATGILTAFYLVDRVLVGASAFSNSFRAALSQLHSFSLLALDMIPGYFTKSRQLYACQAGSLGWCTVKMKP